MLYKSSLSSFARRTGADRSPAGLPVTSMRANPSTTPRRFPPSTIPKPSRRSHPTPPPAPFTAISPASPQPAPTSPRAEAMFFAPDPNADLGHAPTALDSCETVPAAYTTFPAHSSPFGFAYFGASNGLLRDTFLVAHRGASHLASEKSSTPKLVANRANNTVTASRLGMLRSALLLLRERSPSDFI